MKKVKHDKETDIATVSWWRRGEKHIGHSEEIGLPGCTIIVDRNKKGEVRELEII